MNQALSIHVVGQVQGVFYRTSTQSLASRLRLCGWVQNNADGSVSIHAEGQEQALNELVKWCRHGPPLARVKEVKTVAAQPEGHRDFVIR